MTTQHDVRAWRGRTLVDRDGDKIGKIQDVYLDRSSGEPEWIAVKTGLLGSNVSFVPVHDATPRARMFASATRSTWSRTPRTSTPTGSCRQRRSAVCTSTMAARTTTTGAPTPRTATDATYGRDTGFNTVGDAGGPWAATRPARRPTRR